MLSTILGDFIKNVEELCLALDMKLSQPVAFAENWEEQGGARVVRVRPTKGKGAGPNFHGYGLGGTLTNQMVRKVWTTIEVQCWGMPASATDYPNPQEQLLHNTDDTEDLRQIVIVAMNQAIPGGYHYLGETWNLPGEVMMYGRCLTMTFELEQPIADLPLYETEAVVQDFQLTGEIEQ